MIAVPTENKAKTLVSKTAKPRQNEGTEQEARSQSESGMVTGRPQKRAQKRGSMQHKRTAHKHVCTYMDMCLYVWVNKILDSRADRLHV